MLPTSYDTFASVKRVIIIVVFFLVILIVIVKSETLCSSIEFAVYS